MRAPHFRPGDRVRHCYVTIRGERRLSDGIVEQRSGGRFYWVRFDDGERARLEEGRLLKLIPTGGWGFPEED